MPDSALPPGLPAVVIKRLGEAVHGVRGRGKRWIAVQKVKPYAARIFKTEDACASAQLDSDWVVYTTGEADLDTRTPTRPDQVRVQSVRLTYAQEPESSSKEIPVGDFEDGGIDALFLSKSAVEKFLVVYYAALYGPDRAKAVVDTFVGADVAALVHLPQTDYTTIDDLAPPEEHLWGLRLLAPPQG